MSTSTATRRDAARALGRFMGTRAARDLFAFNGYVSGTRIRLFTIHGVGGV